MTLTVLKTQYEQLAFRVNSIVPNACLPLNIRSSLSPLSELSFIQLVNWAYALFFEAARIPCTFLGELAPGSQVRSLKNDVTRLRTYLAHNLIDTSASDRKTIEFLKRWFRGVCGKDFPSLEDDFTSCFGYLRTSVEDALTELLNAASLFADPADGPGLSEDLKFRISREWPAYRYDSIAAEVAAELGLAFIDIRQLRERRLDAWRRAMSLANSGLEIELLKRLIEGDLIDISSGMISPSAAEVLATLKFGSTEALVAALLAIRAAEQAGIRSISKLLEAMGE